MATKHTSIIKFTCSECGAIVAEAVDGRLVYAHAVCLRCNCKMLVGQLGPVDQECKTAYIAGWNAGQDNILKNNRNQ